jgi:hypothetical protein
VPSLFRCNNCFYPLLKCIVNGTPYASVDPDPSFACAPPSIAAVGRLPRSRKVPGCIEKHTCELSLDILHIFARWLPMIGRTEGRHDQTATSFYSKISQVLRVRVAPRRVKPATSSITEATIQMLERVAKTRKISLSELFKRSLK